jgi:predicted dehydrogenase/threonine dehydrogenase-like Zn-dependent dehydrogenase
MKQLMQNISTGKVVVVEVPAPRAGLGELLVRVAASVISSGTERMAIEFAEKNALQKAFARPDLVRRILDKASREGVLSTWEAVRRRLDSDLALGYSNAGTVIDIGADVTGYQLGDRVACAGGGYACHAEIVRVPKNLVAKVPAFCERSDEIDFEEAAFTTLGAIALQGFRLGQLQLGETVAVVGLGVIGLLTVQLAVAAGCRVVGMDIIAGRCQRAHDLGCTATAQTNEGIRAQVTDLSHGAGADVVIISASTNSSAPMQVAGELARDRARIVVVGAVGLDIPRKLYYEKELTVHVSRSYGPGRYDPGYEEKGHDYPVGYVRWTENRNMQAFLQLLADGRITVRPLITHRFPIQQAERAYELITGKTDESFLGVVINYPCASPVSRRIELNPEPPAGGSGREQIAVGVIGAGTFVSTVLLPILKATPNLELIGLATATGATASAVGRRFGFRFCASEEEELLRDPAINTILIATRHHLHARQVVAAWRAGKHVFCEKPLCVSEEELAAIIRCSQAINANTYRPMLMVGFNRRFAPLVRRLRDFLHSTSEPLVAHYRINAGWLPPNHWTQDPEQGGGHIVGEVCHFVDLLGFLVGGPAVAVRVSALPNQGRYCDDNVVATIDFSDGSIGTITYVANGDQSFSKERLEVFAGQSVAVLDDFRVLTLVRGGRSQTFRSRFRQDKGHRGEWQAFVQAIRTGAAAPIPFTDIVNTTLTTLEIVEAVRTGERRIIDNQRLLSAATHA